jgi:tRNA A-37 threonylcarbamoyl transferase component Bud32
MTAFGRLVGRMHAEGLFHRDLKLSNFAVSRADGLGPPQFWLLDLDSLNARRRLTWGRRVKNLAQVEDYAECKIPGVRWAHRGWFLRGYLAENPELRPRARELVALIRLAVARRSARRARKKGIMPNAQRTLTAIK